MQTGRRLPVTFVRGRGCLLYDDAGREYLDLVAGIAVNLLGHAHPDV
ncbi:MAG: aminotransferase class III-fold pyridoxal phosphate-dependent enzyme, partial [Chloroflexi bacterium]